MKQFIRGLVGVAAFAAVTLSWYRSASQSGVSRQPAVAAQPVKAQPATDPAPPKVPPDASVPAPAPDDILRLVDINGRKRFVLGTVIVRVEEAEYADPGTCNVFVASPSWIGSVTVKYDIEKLAQEWAKASGHTISPITIGTAPAAGGPKP